MLLPEASGLEPKLLRATEQAALRAPRLPLGAHRVSRTSWRPSTVALVVQIPNQAPEGSRWGPLGSSEHTDFSLLAARKPLLPLAGPSDVVLLPRLIWIQKQRDLSALARGLRTGIQALRHRTS